MPSVELVYLFMIHLHLATVGQRSIKSTLECSLLKSVTPGLLSAAATHSPLQLPTGDYSNPSSSRQIRNNPQLSIEHKHPDSIGDSY